MSTAPDPKFPNLPGLIFGCSPSKHRRSSLRMLLGRYNVKLSCNDKKEDCLLKLVELENSVGEREKEALVNWFAGEPTCKALAALLSDAMKPPIIPKNIDEPAAKRAKLEKGNEEDDFYFAAVNECRICMEELAPERFPQTRIASTCAHHPTVCSQCLTKHIDVQIQTRASDQVQCPECPAKISDAEIKSYASPEVLERKGRGALMMSLQHLPNFTFCLSLTCESGQIHTGDQPMMVCSACGFKTCFSHKLPWHEGLTCAEFDNLNQARVQQEAASEAWIAAYTKLCPSPKCGMRVEKRSGCDHLICDYCCFEFCWPCLADFRVIKRRGNDFHKEDCRYHTSNENGVRGHGRRRTPAARQPRASKIPKKSKDSKGMEDSKLSEVGKAPKESNVKEGMVESKDANGLKDVKQPHEPNAPRDFKQLHNPHNSEDFKQTYNLDVPQDLKQSKDANGLKDVKQPHEPNAPRNFKQLHNPNNSEDFKQTHNLNVPQDLKQSNELQAHVNLAEPLELTGKIKSHQPNPLKRPREE